MKLFIFSSWFSSTLALVIGLEVPGLTGEDVRLGCPAWFRGLARHGRSVGGSVAFATSALTAARGTEGKASLTSGSRWKMDGSGRRCKGSHCQRSMEGSQEADGSRGCGGVGRHPGRNEDGFRFQKKPSTHFRREAFQLERPCIPL